MTALNQQQIIDLFCDIESRLLGATSVILEYLNNLKPACSELSQVEWRYRLSGFLEGLSLTGHIDSLYIESLASKLFARDVRGQGVRPGRAHAFSIDIITDQSKIYRFDVPSTNPLDAYAQLTKRTAYNAIPGIEAIEVYTGFWKDRAKGSAPVRIFAKSELIYSNL